MFRRLSVLNLLFAMSYGPSTGAHSRDRAGHPDFMPFRLDPFYEPLHNAALKFPEDAFQPNSHLMFVALPQLESVIQASTNDRDD